MSALSLPGCLAGLMLGIGLWLVLTRLPLRRQPTLDQRLEPYLIGVPGVARRAGALAGGELRRSAWFGVPGSGTGVGSPFSRVASAVRRGLLTSAARLARPAGDVSPSVRRRLEQLGRDGDVEAFRAEQVLCGLAGAALGAGLGSIGVLAGHGLSPVPLLGLILIGAVTGVLARDQLLSWQVRRREDRMMAEFPTVAELLALAVGAGEGPVGALDRVARTCRGELSAELRRMLADARTGASLVDALTGMAARTSVPGLARFVDGLTVAVERGTPLADVLRAQAQDARTQARRRLMESGGRREIAMMVPVVFGVLPVTVLFAVYPGLVVLDLSG